MDDERKNRPTAKQLLEWEMRGGCEATDGCWVEADGICEHGCKSWLVEISNQQPAKGGE